MSGVSDVGSLRCVGRRYNFLKYERVILNFYHPSIQSSRLQRACRSKLEFNSMHAVCHPILAYRGGGGGGEGKRLNITVH